MLCGMSFGFQSLPELILTGERVKAGIKSDKIQKDTSASAAIKKTFPAKKESSAVYTQRNREREECRPTVGAVLNQKSASDQPRNSQPRNDQPKTYQQRVERPQRQYTPINMTPAQILPHLLKLTLASLREAPKNTNTTSPHYHPNAKCAYHLNSAGNDTNSYWALKNKI